MKREFESCSNLDRHFKLFNGLLHSSKLFGQADAVTEWNQSESISSQLFVHTESYEIFKDNSLLFLFGRRGTGKTATLKMLEYEINEGLLNSYNYCTIIGQEENFYRLTLELRNSTANHSKNELMNVLKDKWKWIIYNSAMINVVESNSDYKKNPHLSKVADYLKSQKFLTQKDVVITKSPITKAIDIFSKSFNDIDYSPLKIGIALIQATRELYSESYEDALNSLVLFLRSQKKTALILIDSKEMHEFNDEISEAAISALMDASLEIFQKSFQYNINVKVAFPSEIFPHLSPSNQGKTRDKGHYIMWRYKDLLNFIIKRYTKILAESNIEYKELDNSATTEEMKEFIYKYLPKTTSSFSEIEFDTISYIISHTQKKPRQVILLFNNILSLAAQHGISFSNLTPICIKEGTNARLEDLTAGILDMYRQLYPQAPEIVKKTLFDSKNLLDFGDLHSQMSESNGIISRHNMTRENVERLLLETGIIGIVQDEHKLNDSKSIIMVVFEYQIKDVITITSKHHLAIHPMFYQGLNIRVDKNSFIYPKPADDEPSILKENILNEDWH